MQTTRGLALIDIVRGVHSEVGSAKFISLSMLNHLNAGSSTEIFACNFVCEAP